MSRLLWFPALLLTVVLALPVALIHALPLEDRAVGVFLTASPDCTALCLMDIRPGVTTVAEALAQLRANDWVADANLNASGRGYGEIRWSWSGRQPDLINADRPGRVTFYWDEDDIYDGRGLNDMQIETVSIYTRIRMYQAQRWLGTPDSGTAAYNIEDKLGYSAAYHNAYGMLEISTVLVCPASLMTYWEARAKIVLSQWRGGGRYVEPTDVVHIC